jgi:hypothetical protein
MPKISREVDNVTLGGRLEQFRPVNKFGEEVYDGPWAEEIGISAKQLGVILKNKANVTSPFIQAISCWMLKTGYSHEDVTWWLVGGNKPRPSSLKKSEGIKVPHWNAGTGGGHEKPGRFDPNSSGEHHLPC